jgi:hypothetical protein
MLMLDGREAEVRLPLLLLLLEIIIMINTATSGDGSFVSKFYVPCLHMCR